MPNKLLCTLLTSAALVSLGTTGAFAQSKDCGVVDLLEIMAIQPSSGTDSDVNQALAGMASNWAAAQGQSNKDVGTSLAGSTDPKTAGLGALLMASGGTLEAMSGLFLSIDGVISAIDESRDDADDLYLALNTERGADGAFWPSPGESSELATKGTTVKMPGISGLVPYVLGLLSDDSISIQLFDWDGSSRDDHLGQVTFSLEDAGLGPLNTMMISEKHGGVVYAIRYQVVPVSCDFPLAENMKAAQSKSYSTEEGSAGQFGSFMLFGYPFLAAELKAAGVVL